MDLVYGPVQSLRYGTTLGINLLGPTKICSYDCGYCSLGPSLMTMNRARKEYVFPSLDDVQLAFRTYIRKSVVCEAIVVSGNGEPTLYPEFELAMRTVSALRDEHLPKTKIIVLSNGAHLDQKKVVGGMNLVDERVIKVDAGSDTLLQKLNAPLVRLNVAKFLASVGKLKDCVVQSLFVDGPVSNITAEAVDEWIEIVGMIKPQRLQLSTATRPALTVPGLKAVEDDALYGIAFKLKKRTGLEAQVFTAQKS